MITITCDREDGDVEDTWTITDSGDAWDPAEGLCLADAMTEITERGEHYMDAGHEVIVDGRPAARMFAWDVRPGENVDVVGPFQGPNWCRVCRVDGPFGYTYAWVEEEVKAVVYNKDGRWRVLSSAYVAD